MWARNANDGNKIQAFYVEQGTAGFIAEKMERKYSMRAMQNGDIVLDNVFVPDRNKLAHAKDFSTGTNKILEASRLSIAWQTAAIAAGAYEAALKYTLNRVQFGRPIA